MAASAVQTAEALATEIADVKMIVSRIHRDRRGSFRDIQQGRAGGAGAQNWNSSRAIIPCAWKAPSPMKIVHCNRAVLTPRRKQPLIFGSVVRPHLSVTHGDHAIFEQLRSLSVSREI